MSSGKLDDKYITFEINSNRIFGRFTLLKIDGDDSNPDRVRMSLHAESYQHPDSLVSECSVMIDKRKTRVLSGFFRDAADILEKWYEENE